MVSDKIENHIRLEKCQKGVESFWKESMETIERKMEGWRPGQVELGKQENTVDEAKDDCQNDKG